MKVIMIPDNHDYIKQLKNSLESEGVDVTLMSYFHYAAPYNFLKIMILKLKGFNIFHIHFEYSFPFTFFMKFLIKFLKMLDYKIVWTAHDIYSEYIYKKLRSKEKSRWLYENVDYKFVHYKSNLTRVKECFDVEINNVEVIFHPSFDYPNTISREEARKSLGIPSSKKVLLSFGMIKRYKGQIELIKAFEKLDKSYFCLIVGSGKNDIETTEYIKNKAKQYKDRLLFIDKYIPEDEIQIYFNASDVVVLPYTEITQSGIVPLAQSFSKPVIATDVGALSEMVIHGKTGLLIPPNDLNALEKSIKEIFAMDINQMSKNAHSEGKKHSWENLAKQTIKIYRKVLDGKK